MKGLKICAIKCWWVEEINPNFGFFGTSMVNTLHKTTASTLQSLNPNLSMQDETLMISLLNIGDFPLPRFIPSKLERSLPFCNFVSIHLPVKHILYIFELRSQSTSSWWFKISSTWFNYSMQDSYGFLVIWDDPNLASLFRSSTTTMGPPLNSCSLLLDPWRSSLRSARNEPRQYPLTRWLWLHHSF